MDQTTRQKLLINFMSPEEAERVGDNLYHFTDKDLRLAKHLLAKQIKLKFGKVWEPKSDAEYLTAQWDCYHPIAFDGGIWRLIEHVIHKYALKCAGFIEVRNAGTMMRFIAAYDTKEKGLIYEKTGILGEM